MGVARESIYNDYCIDVSVSSGRKVPRVSMACFAVGLCEEIVSVSPCASWLDCDCPWRVGHCERKVSTSFSKSAPFANTLSLCSGCAFKAECIDSFVQSPAMPLAMLDETKIV